MNSVTNEQLKDESSLQENSEQHFDGKQIVQNNKEMNKTKKVYQNKCSNYPNSIICQSDYNSNKSNSLQHC